jgi:diguanylate cyclase (GGDEF)-like protein
LAFGVAEPEETVRIERVARRRLLDAPVLFMIVFALAGWGALVAVTLTRGVGAGAPPLAFAAFLLVVVAVRVMATRMLPASPLSLDSAFYIASAACLGAVAAGWLVAVALTLDALLRHVGVDPVARRARAPRSSFAAKVFVPYYGGMSAGVLLASAWLFAVDRRPLVDAGEAEVFFRVIGFGLTLLIVHYVIQGARLVLSGEDAREYLHRMAVPGIAAEASLLPLAVVVVLVYRPERPLGFILLAATYLLITFVFNRLSHASERLRQRVAELTTLNRTARALASTLDRHELVETIGRETLEAIPEAELFTLSHREREDAPHFVVDWLDRDRGKFERLRTRAGEGISSFVVEHRRPLLITDLARAVELGEIVVSSDPGVRSWLGVPLTIYDQVIGVLSVQSRERAAFGEDHRRVLEAIAAQAAVAIQNARLYELATIDGLTGLYVRRYFDSRLREELERSRRFGTQFSVVLLDLDDFKKLNDTFGHAVGDRVLREVAASMRRSLRGVDIAARYGGEEFAFILPRTGIVDAHAVAERIRHDVSEVRIAHEGRVLSITASLGIASYPESAPGDVAMLLEKADVALYRAKTSGKDRVEVYWGEEPEPIRPREGLG